MNMTSSKFPNTSDDQTRPKVQTAILLESLKKRCPAQLRLNATGGFFRPANLCACSESSSALIAPPKVPAEVLQWFHYVLTLSVFVCVDFCLKVASEVGLFQKIQPCCARGLRLDSSRLLFLVPVPPPLSRSCRTSSTDAV